MSRIRALTSFIQFLRIFLPILAFYGVFYAKDLDIWELWYNLPIEEQILVFNSWPPL